jgi:hypothetical protein
MLLVVATTTLAPTTLLATIATTEMKGVSGALLVLERNISQNIFIGPGTVRAFNHGFCCVRVRVMVIGLQLLYGARLRQEIYTRRCNWLPLLLA